MDLCIMSFTQKDEDFTKLLTDYFSERNMKTDFPCPDEETLYAYINGKADRTVTEDVEKHLLECERCLKTVISCFELLDQPYGAEKTEVPLYIKNRIFQNALIEENFQKKSLWQRFKQRWVNFADSVSQFLSPGDEECVYVRGEKKVISNNLVILEKVFREIKLQIEVEKTGHMKSNIKVAVQNPVGGEGISDIRINIMEDSKEIASFVTTQGEVVFEDLPFGKYMVTASRNGKKLGEVLLKIEEKKNDRI